MIPETQNETGRNEKVFLELMSSETSDIQHVRSSQMQEKSIKLRGEQWTLRTWLKLKLHWSDETSLRTDVWRVFKEAVASCREGALGQREPGSTGVLGSGIRCNRKVNVSTEKI